MKRIFALSSLLLIIGATVLTGCSTGQTGAPVAEDPDKNLTLVSYDSFVMDDATKTAFEAQSGYTLNIVLAGGGNELANKLRLTTAAPIADVVYGLDDTTTGALKTENAIIGAEPTARGDVCLNADKEYFTKNKLAYPTSFEDLGKKEYFEKLVLESPITSTPGYIWFAGIISKYDTDTTVTVSGEGYQPGETVETGTGLKTGTSVINSFITNGVKIVDSWTKAYNSDFTQGENHGKYPLVLSYSTSPAWTVTDDEQDTTTTSLDWSCVKDTEYTSILNNTKHPVGAQLLLDFMQTDEFQSTLPDTIYLYPASPTAPVPGDWAKFTKLSDDPIILNDTLLQDKENLLQLFRTIIE
jgi:thiamine transport system substrate-binding protein